MEKNTTHLNGREAAKKIKELADHARSCMMMTALSQRPISVRPMGIQKTDEHGRMYFFSSKDSGKNAEIGQSSEMQLTIANDGNSEYLNLYGKAEVYRDQKEIDDMYNAFANTWFEGKEDPMLTIIRFTPEDGHYWDSKHGKLIQMAGLLVGAITGKQTDDGLQGDLKL